MSYLKIVNLGTNLFYGSRSITARNVWKRWKLSKQAHTNVSINGIDSSGAHTDQNLSRDKEH